DQRYPSARELSEDVEHFLEGAVVEAYVYRFGDKLARLYRGHRALINSVAAATAAIVLIGIMSYISIYRAKEAEEVARIMAEEERAIAQQQRNIAIAQQQRAETAERQTAQEKYVS